MSESLNSVVKSRSNRNSTTNFPLQIEDSQLEGATSGETCNNAGASVLSSAFMQNLSFIRKRFFILAINLKDGKGDSPSFTIFSHLSQKWQETGI